MRGEDGGAVQEGREHAKRGGKKGRRGGDEARGKHVWRKRDWTYMDRKEEGGGGTWRG